MSIFSIFWNSFSFWPKKLNFNGLTGCSLSEPNPACLQDASPALSTDYIKPTPERVRKADYENGIKITWAPPSQPLVTNCDGSTEGVKLVCKFDDQNLEVLPDKNGNLIVEKTLYHEPSGSVVCDVYYVNPLDDNPSPKLYPNKAITLYSPVEANVCSNVPDPGAITRTPDLSEIAKGDSTKFTWEVKNLTDCNGDPLSLVYHNANDILNNPSVSYDQTTKTLTISGSILPTINSGTIRLIFQDTEGNQKVINLYLPSITPLEIVTPNSYIQQGKPATFTLLASPSGATNYRFWVTLPDGTYGDESNLGTPTYVYTPYQLGMHVLNLEITTYNGSHLLITHPFVVNESSADQVCYSVPDPGPVTQSPYLSQIVRGDNTLLTWKVKNLTDCTGGPLTLFSNNAADFLYDEAVNYNGSTLTVSGKIRSDIVGGGSMRFTFLDKEGEIKIINIFLPSIVEPEIVITDPWITPEEDLTLQLSPEPSGCSYLYVITKPDNTTIDSGVLSSSLYNLPAASKTQPGLYNIHLYVTASDGKNYSIYGTFKVNKTQ